MPDSTLSVSSIASRIHALSLNWLAKDNELTALSDAERHLRLGAIPPAGKTLAELARLFAFLGHHRTAQSERILHGAHGDPRLYARRPGAG